MHNPVAEGDLRQLTSPTSSTRRIQRFATAASTAAGLALLTVPGLELLQAGRGPMAASCAIGACLLAGVAVQQASALAAERRRATKAIQAQQALSRSLAGQLEDERRRIAGDLHDSLNALLIRIRLDAQGISRATVDRPADLAAIRGRASDISDHVATLYAQCSALMQQLRPEAIDLVGLHEALSDMINGYNRAHPSCAVALAVDGEPHSLPEDVGIATYRIVQEALSNAIKHANATQVRVQLRVDAEHGHVAISVTDDGQGLDIAHVQRGRGMAGMRQRAQALGGSLQVDSNPGAGTAITAQLSWPVGG